MEKQKKYWFCDFCEIQILKVSKSRHEKTKKHEQNLTRRRSQTEPTHQVVEEVVVPIVEEVVVEKVVIEEIVSPIVEEIVEEKVVIEEYKSPRSQDRLECFERNKYWINDPKWEKGKGAFMRKSIIWFLRVFSKSNFRDEEHEYQCIGKFGRGFCLLVRLFHQEYA